MILLSTINFSCSSYTKIYCGTNKETVRLVPKKNPFEYDFKENNKNISLIVSMLQKLIDKAEISVSDKSLIKQQIEQLNQSNITYNQTLRAAYTALVLNPCSEKAFDKYMELLNNKDTQRVKLEELQTGLNRVIETNGLGGTNPDEAISLIQKYLNTKNEK